MYQILTIKKNLTSSNYTIGKGTGRIDYIVVHYTGNNGDTAWANTNYFKSTFRGASAHYFVDENSIWQCVEDKNISWHCGAYKYYNSCRNSNSIGVEMCSRKNNNTYYFKDQVVNKTVSLVKELMKKYNVPLSRVVRHWDVSRKICPAPYCGNSKNDKAWNDFKNMLTSCSDKLPTSSNIKYRVRKTSTGAKEQKGAFIDLNNAKKLADENRGYKVFDLKGNIIYNPQSVNNNTNIDNIVTVIGATSYLRNNAMVSAKVLKAINVGTTLEWIIDDKWGWSKVKATDETIGWIQNARLSGKETLSTWRLGKFTGSGVVNVRSSKSTISKNNIVTTIKENGTFPIISIESSWIRTNMILQGKKQDLFIYFDKSYIKIGEERRK